MTPTITPCTPGEMLQRDTLTVFGFYASEDKDSKLGAWIAYQFPAPDGARFVAERDPTPSEVEAFHGARLMPRLPALAEPHDALPLTNDRGVPIRRMTLTHADFKRPVTPPHHFNPIDPREVLAYIHEHDGQEDDDEQVAGFAQDMAAMIDEGKNYRDAGMAGYAAFVEWVDERPRIMNEAFSLDFHSTDGTVERRNTLPLRIFYSSGEGVTVEHGWFMEAIDMDRRECIRIPLALLQPAATEVAG